MSCEVRSAIEVLEPRIAPGDMAIASLSMFVLPNAIAPAGTTPVDEGDSEPELPRQSLETGPPNQDQDRWPRLKHAWPGLEGAARNPGRASQYRSQSTTPPNRAESNLLESIFAEAGLQSALLTPAPTNSEPPRPEPIEFPELPEPHRPSGGGGVSERNAGGGGGGASGGMEGVFSQASVTGQLAGGHRGIQSSMRMMSGGPIAHDDPNYQVPHDFPLDHSAGSVLANDEDTYARDGDQLTASLVSQPQHGTLTDFQSNGVFSYTPDPGYTGTDSFTYSASDISGSDTATVTITVINHPPDAVDDSGYQVSRNGTIQINFSPTGGGILANDTDLEPMDELSLTATVESQPQHGTLVESPAGDYVTYTPDPGYVGQDSFTYSASDGIASDTATVTIDVLNIPPVADAGFGYPIGGGDSLHLDGTGSHDPNGDSLTYEWDLDADGMADATGVSPVIDWTALYLLGFRQGELKVIELTVSDGIAEDTDTAMVTVGLPIVWVSATPEAGMGEHATIPQTGHMRFYRTGATEEPLTVNFGVAGTATPGDDYVALGGSVTIPVGETYVDLPITVANDHKVEGTQTIVFGIQLSDDYEIGPGSGQGVAPIQDNDSWQWVAFTGSEKTSQAVFQNLYLPGFDDWNDPAPASMFINGSVDATNNSVSAQLYGGFINPGLLGTVNRMIEDNLYIEFDYHPITGDISRSDLNTTRATVADHELEGAIGFTYDVNNSGELSHTVTITIELHDAVDETVTTTASGGAEAGNNGSSGAVDVSVSETSSIGGKLKSLAGITLHLEVVEDDN